MRTSIFLLGFVALIVPVSAAAEQPPNIVVICLDDLNDWIGCMSDGKSSGHPQVKTPQIDRLATRGLLFTNAHVQATFCGPSRVSFLSGRMPITTGCYGFDRYESLEKLKGHPAFPHYLKTNGYATYGGGKIFHHGIGPAQSWTQPLAGGGNPQPGKRMHWNKKIWDWGPWPERDDQMGDFKLAKSAAKVLQQKHDRPFFVMVGIRRPHVPLHVPQKWFDLYPEADVVLPKAPSDDLDDVPHPEIGLTPHAAPRHSELVKRDLWRSLTRAYLASISFVDHCVGEIVRGLDAGPNRDNTVVILFSDHGFHLGEKQHWAKRTLWEETTRVPLIIAGPGIAAGGKCSRPVGMIDLYPTLCELAGRKPPPGLEGHSLAPLLSNPTDKWPHPVLTTFKPGDHSVRSEDWRYIRYADGKEELYDHRVDPNEWKNLAPDPKFADILREHAKWLK